MIDNKLEKIIKPEDVNPKEWRSHQIIFNEPEENYSAIFGYYRGCQSCLGLRWNGHAGNERGNPGEGDEPCWFLVPDALTLSTLERLLVIATEKKLTNEFGELYSNELRKIILEYSSDSYLMCKG